MNIGPIVDKFKAFGWNVIEIDGHDFDQIFAALDMAKETVGKPTMIIAKTIKVRAFHLWKITGWHGAAPSDSDLETALLDLGVQIMTKMATRDAYGKALVKLGQVNDNVVVLDADLSKSTKTMIL